MVSGIDTDPFPGAPTLDQIIADEQRIDHRRPRPMSAWKSYAAVLVACVATMLGTLYVVDHTRSGLGYGMTYHDVRTEFTGLTDTSILQSDMVASRGQWSPVLPSQTVRVYSPAAVVLTVYVEQPGQATCRIFVDGALVREQVASANSAATCSWVG